MEFDENKALNLILKKRHNKKPQTFKKTSKYKRVNDFGDFRNNAKNFQYDYEEDYYEPRS